MARKHDNALVGAIEAGGTKFVCAVGTGPENRILSKTSFSTGENPVQLLAEVTGWLGEQERRHGKLQAVGVASFGPVDLDEDSQTYGYITSTPKHGWKNTNIVGHIRRAFGGIPIGFDTDVNGAALGEFYWGSAKDLRDFVYVTIGTGIGAGGMVGGQLIHGLMHPEMGHMMLPRAPGDEFKGFCEYHDACWEGLCSGPALLERSGIQAENLPPDHEAWVLETQYIAYAIANIVYILSPQRVILGGSVRKAGQLGEQQFFRLIREKVKTTLKRYIASPALNEGIDGYIVPPLLGDDAGVCGAIALGQMAITSQKPGVDSN